MLDKQTDATDEPGCANMEPEHSRSIEVFVGVNLAVVVAITILGIVGFSCLAATTVMTE